MNMPETAPAGIASQLKLDAHWMPFSANRAFQRDPRLIVAAEGSGADAKVQINFGPAGVKWLLLAVAKLDPA